MDQDLFARDVVNAVLRANLPYFAIACVVMVAGVSALLVARIRRGDRLLRYVGIFSVLYAARLFFQNELTRDAVNSRGDGYVPYALCITYVINIPFALFARELFGTGWNRTITLWVWLSVGFAVIGIPLALFADLAHWTDLANGVLVVSGTVLVLLHSSFGGRVMGSFAAPLFWPLLIFGTLVMMENKGIRPKGFDLEPMGFLILLGGLGWTAVRRALATERKLMEVEQELATARRIQDAIIPHEAPDFPSVQVATRYQPMTSVAGDFFDFLNPDGQTLTILVADVSGHGVPAALVASMLKVCFSAQRDRAPDPAAILAGLNTMLRGSLGGQYVTAACAAIDRGAGTITYAGAGHPPSLLLRRDGREMVQLAENGLFIGPFPMATYKNVAVPFQAGDRLLLYTDGIVEANGRDGQEFGRERLEQLFLRAADEAPAVFMDWLFREISSGEQQDDLTAVLAQFD